MRKHHKQSKQEIDFLKDIPSLEEIEAKFKDINWEDMEIDLASWNTQDWEDLIDWEQIKRDFDNVPTGDWDKLIDWEELNWTFERINWEDLNKALDEFNEKI